MSFPASICILAMFGFSIFGASAATPLYPANHHGMEQHRRLHFFERTTREPSNQGYGEVRWSVGAEQMCAKGAAEGRSTECNAHNERLHCDCGAEQFRRSASLPVCKAVLPLVERPEEQLLTVGIAFPLVEQFLEDPERLFLEDLEIFTFIPRESVVLFRHGCSPDGAAYEFQFGVLDSCARRKPQPQQPVRLRTLSPRILLANPFFMHENALKVAYVRKARSQ